MAGPLGQTGGGEPAPYSKCLLGVLNDPRVRKAHFPSHAAYISSRACKAAPGKRKSAQRAATSLRYTSAATVLPYCHSSA
ncbi:hypothetical protein NDU88_002770 [Pleurodeles waltl]|uniref:Uncharacterized protein n=1 Tax=Pleurodeles waltl TaxID=8319 RepID=A0AAV7UC20_PLEWA|nr:hypothetical protein NDU88_002770 [Pleurodeles waltl]